MKTVVKIIVSVLVISYMVSSNPFSIQAEIETVNDCIENPEHCEEPLLEENETNQPTLLQPEETGSLFLEIVRLVFALLIVLGLIYVFLYFIKRKNKFGNRLTSLDNIGAISVGQNKSVQIIRLKDRIYLIGVGENVTLLEEIKDETLINELLSEREEQTPEFDAVNLFSSILQKKKANEVKQKPFNNLFQEELNRLQKNRKTIIDRHKEDQE